MLHRTWGRLGASDTSASFLPLSFRLFASFGLLVLHAALPADVRAAGPGERLYVAALVLMFAEAAWESGRGLMALDQLFPTPRNGWIRWNLGLDLALVSLVIAFQGVMQERFATLYIFPVLASAFYLGTVEIVWVGVLSSLTHVVLVPRIHLRGASILRSVGTHRGSGPRPPLVPSRHRLPSGPRNHSDPGAHPKEPGSPPLGPHRQRGCCR